MLLSFRFLTDVATVNSFEAVVAAEISKGDAQDLYIQLIDASVDRAEQGYSPAGRRYMPAATSTMTITFTNTNTGPTTGGDFQLSPRINPGSLDTFTRAATQPFSQDASIWKVPLLSTDPLNGTVQMKVVLTTPSGPMTVAQMPGLCLRVR